jgi:hypothetical protein
LLDERERVPFGLSLENISGLRRKLRKKLENGTKQTRVLMSNSWVERKVEGENAGTHDFSINGAW